MIRFLIGLGLILSLLAASGAHAANCDFTKLILMIDIGAVQTDDAKRRFNDGLKKFLGEDKVEGKLLVYQLKARAAEANEQACLEPIPADTPPKPDAPKNAWGSFWQGAWEQVAGDGDRKKARERLRQTIDRLQRERRELADRLYKKLGPDATPITGKEILPSIVSIIQSECTQEATCSIFLYSDLIDRRSQVVTNNTRLMNIDYARMLGAQDGDLVRQNLNARKPSSPITFKVWGQETGSEDQRKLAQYWAGALSSLNPSKLPEPQITSLFAW